MKARNRRAARKNVDLEPKMRKLIKKLGKAWATVGPYVILEAVMPGGTLLALLLYLHRRWRASPAG
jgi:hypothetical protein